MGLGITSFDFKVILSPYLRVKFHGNLVETRHCKSECRITGGVGIHTHHRPYGPCRHSTAVLIAGYTVGSCGEIFVEQFTYNTVGTPFLSFYAREEIRIDDVGLVGRVIKSVVEYGLESLNKLLFAAMGLNHSLYIVGNGEGIVPRVSFMKSGRRLKVFSLAGIERCEERTVGQTRTEHTEFWIEVVVPSGRTLGKQSGIDPSGSG